MIRAEGDSSLDRTPPIVEALARRSVDEVDRYLEPRGAGGSDRGGHVFRRVGAIEGCQHVRHGGLHPDRQARDARGGQFGCDCFGDGVGIRLDGDFGTGCQAEGGAHSPEHLREIARRQKGRCPTAEEHGLRGPQRAGIRQHATGEIDLAKDLIGVRVLARAPQFGGGVGIEVAISAADAAERDVKVHTEISRRIDDQVIRQCTIHRCRVADGQSGTHQDGEA